MIPDYDIVTAYARQTNNGGVLILVRTDTKYKVNSVPAIKALANESTCELCCVSITSKKSTVNVIGVYRPPKGDFNSFLNCTEAALLVDKISDTQTYIVGDFNVDVLVNSKKKTRELLSLVDAFEFKNTFLEPTRVSDTSSTCIDNVFLNCPNLTFNLLVVKDAIVNQISDHMLQSFQVKIGDYVPLKIMYTEAREINQQTLQHLNLLLEKEDWQELYSCSDPDSAFERYTDIFKHYLDIACPKKKIKNKPRKSTSGQYSDLYNDNIKQFQEWACIIDSCLRNNVGDTRRLKKHLRHCKRQCKKALESKRV